MVAGLPGTERFPPAPLTVRVLVPTPVPVTVSDGGVVQTTVSETVAGGGGMTVVVIVAIVDGVVLAGGGVVVVVVGTGGAMAVRLGDELGEPRVETRMAVASTASARAGTINRSLSAQMYQRSV